MARPAKRRKRNDEDSPAKAGRGIDYFFSKKPPNQEEKAPKLQRTVGGEMEKPENTLMTDEELARKLQLEWNQGDQEAFEVSKTGQKLPISKLNESSSDQVELKETKGVPQLKTLALQSTANDEDLIASHIPFDESPLSFEPSMYLPDLQNRWATEGGHATYAILTRCFVLVNGTSSRIKIVDTLVNMLRVLIEGDSESLLPAVRPQTSDLR
jgi:DNA ligase-1